MEIKQIFKIIMVFSLIGMLFSGCGGIPAEESSLNNDNTIKNNIDDSNKPNIEREIKESQTIEKTIEDEFISEDDDIELGDLI